MAASKYKETAHDYRLAYGGCFVYLKNPPENTAPIAIVSRFGNSSDSDGRPPETVTLRTFQLKQEGEEYLNIDKNITVPLDAVEFRSPRPGYVNTPYGAFEVRARKPQGSTRYCRLLNRENITTITPCPDVLNALDAEPYENVLDADVLKYWAAQEVTPVGEAIEALFNGDAIARAISDRFCLTLSTKYEGIVLLYNNTVAGLIPTPTAPVQLLAWARRFTETLEGFGIAVKK